MNYPTSMTYLGLAVISMSLPLSLAQNESSALGKMTQAEFKKVNKDAAAKVKAISPGDTKLSEADAALLAEVARGGMMQLEISKIAVKSAQSSDVREIAEAEVAEQTAMAAKVKEFAKAGNVKLPSQLDEKSKELVDKFKDMEDSEFDKAYLRESGLQGHEMLKATMLKVQSQAEDKNLKMLAVTALPLIEAHLNVSRDELADIG